MNNTINLYDIKTAYTQTMKESDIYTLSIISNPFINKCVFSIEIHGNLYHRLIRNNIKEAVICFNTIVRHNITTSNQLREYKLINSNSIASVG